MRQWITRLSLLAVFAVALYLVSVTHESNDAPSAKERAEAKKLEIVPLVVVKPGETKQLMLSTWCTVGVTRGGGFGLTEMLEEGSSGGFNTKTYSRAGVTISVPNFKDGAEFAKLPEFAALKDRHFNAFQVSITAAGNAEPGLMEMHLIDSTCSGDCQTHFRVLVVKSKE